LSDGIISTNAQQTASNALINAAGAGTAATNQALAIGAGATTLVANASAAATNYSLAIGAGNSNLTLAAYGLSSNAYDRAVAAATAISNDTDEAWSGNAATTTVNLATNRIAAVAGITFINNAVPTNPLSFRVVANQLQYVDSTATGRTVATSGNLSSLGIQTVSGFNSSITNYVRYVATFPTSSGAPGSRGDFSVTNGFAAFNDGSVWHRWATTNSW